MRRGAGAVRNVPRPALSCVFPAVFRASSARFRMLCARRAGFPLLPQKRGARAQPMYGRTRSVTPHFPAMARHRSLRALFREVLQARKGRFAEGGSAELYIVFRRRLVEADVDLVHALRQLARHVAPVDHVCLAVGVDAHRRAPRFEGARHFEQYGQLYGGLAEAAEHVFVIARDVRGDAREHVLRGGLAGEPQLVPEVIRLLVAHAEGAFVRALAGQVDVQVMIDLIGEIFVSLVHAFASKFSFANSVCAFLCTCAANSSMFSPRRAASFSYTFATFAGVLRVPRKGSGAR